MWNSKEVINVKYDMLLRNGYLVDFSSNFEGKADVGIKDGVICDIGEELNIDLAQQAFDLQGAMVMPGIIDTHVHVSAWLGGGNGHKMLAKAGVTSALDMSGPGESVLDLAKTCGVGINLATIEYVRPHHTVADDDPNEAEICSLLDKVLAHGSLGVKLLGGHYPLTPEASERCIGLAAQKNSYVAFHAGTAKNGSNIDGLLEAISLAGSNPLHLAHINAYCRGLVKPYMEETEMAIKALTENPNIISESYLSPLNGTSAEIVDGEPGSLVTRRCLQTGGFAASERGMEEAILAGWAQINYPYAGETILITGEAGRDYWRSRGTDVSVSFAVNPVEPRVRLASAKRPNGKFVVDCISTDGGGIPRNVIIPMGLALVELGALSKKEFVQKASYNPSRMLGLINKGSIAVGKDADITVVDTEKREALMTIVNGRLIMHKGYVCGTGGKIITTAAGEGYVRQKGLEPLIIDLDKSTFKHHAALND